MSKGMGIVIVEDEFHVLEDMIYTVESAAPGAIVAGYRNAEEAMLFTKTMHPEVAFLDVDLQDPRGLNGVDLARKMQEDQPDINIIFTTAYSEYMPDAFAIHASGYLMKPVSQEMVEKELAALRNPRRRSKRRVRVSAFGNFELFIDDKPVKFSYSRTKELFAYLVDRNGAMCTMGELLGMLWPEDSDQKKHTSYINNLRGDLVTTLSRYDCGDILVRERGSIGIVPDLIDCDYYDWIAGKTGTDHAYRGEYMTQYSWAEMTNGKLGR